MTNNEWYQVDNVANVFLASINDRDTRSLRISCTLREDVRKDILQEALDQTVALRPQFHVRIQRGLFWNYMEDAYSRPVVKEEYRRVCPHLYNAENRKRLHYEVTFFKNRINLDLFHAISDGTGALDFLNLLLLNYLKKAHPGVLDDVLMGEGASAADLSEDSFQNFYENNTEAPVSSGKAYHPKGGKLPFNQLQFFELHMPVSEILSRARQSGVSMTSYIGARLIMVLLQDMPSNKRDLPVTISMPVNLRNYYPSASSRNFFNNVNVSHMYTGDENLESLLEEYDRILKESLAPGKITGHMNHYQKLAQSAAIRAVPLLLKQQGLRFAAKQDDSRVSAVISNMGAVKVPKEMQQFINYYSAFCSSMNLFLTICSFSDKLVITVTSPYSSTNVIKNFVRGLTNEDIPVRVFATEVIR